MTPQLAALCLALALAVSSLGFRRLVYFVSLGYAGSISLQAIAAAIVFRDVLDARLSMHLGLLAAYGLRLGGYLALRERSPGYRRELDEVQERATGIGRGKQVLIWLGVSTLYVLMFSPALAALTAAEAATAAGSAAVREFSAWSSWLGVATMGAGLALEALADRQKDRFKREHPSDFCNVGLYRLVRCPNYLGEIVFWVGNFVAGAAFYAGAGWWAAATAGLVCIVLIMMGSTKRLDAKQKGRYGVRPDYQQYSTTVPVLFPFVPVYSLERVRVYLE